MKELFEEIEDQLLKIPGRRRMLYPPCSQEMFIERCRIATLHPYNLFEASVNERLQLPSSLKLTVAKDILTTMDKVEREWAKKYPKGEAA